MEPDPELIAAIRGAVGSVGMRDLEIAVRREMVREALGRSGGNRRAAARMLGVSRQHLQHMLRSLRVCADVEEIGMMR